MSIPVHLYLQDALRLNPNEVELRSEIMSWLPETIIDAHAHANLEAHVIGLDERVHGHMMSTFPWFSQDQSDQMTQQFYPGKKVRVLRFAMPYRGIDHRAANEYLLKVRKPDDRVALLGVASDVDYTNRELESGSYAALKMYYAALDPFATQIYQFFPPAILEMAERCGIPIILHLPSLITQCLEQLIELVQDFPKLPIVLAHLGLPHIPIPGLREAYECAAGFPTVCMDTAMVTSEEVVGLALEVFGSDRILYGSDQPLHLVRNVAYHHPTKGERYVTPYPYHWVDPTEHKEYGHLAEGAVHNQWKALFAIKNALQQLALEDAKEAIFRTNAERVYGF